MSILVTLGNLNPFTFANSIIAANEKAIELFGAPLSRVEVFHSIESFDALQAAKRKENEVTWVGHLEKNGIQEKIIVHRTLEVSSTRESVELFVDNLESIVSDAKKRGHNLLLDLSNGTILSKSLLSNAANVLNIPHKYMIDITKLFKDTDERGFFDPDPLKQSYVLAPDSIHPQTAAYKEQKTTTDKIKVLFIASNAIKKNPLYFDEEIRAITQKIGAAEYGNSIEFIPIFAARADDLIQSFNQHKPHIVHFSVHGALSDKIFLTDNMGLLPHAVNSKSLKVLFSELKDNIRVVVLNTCHSKVQAKAIAGIIDCAIGMKTKIGNKAAAVFAASFYRAIGFGRSVKKAFEQGKLALILEDIHEEDTLEIFVKKGFDPSSLYLIAPPLLDNL
jgi:hypothetical protein